MCRIIQEWFDLESPLHKFCGFVDDELFHKYGEYDVTGFFRSAANWKRILTKSTKIRVPTSVDSIISVLYNRDYLQKKVKKGSPKTSRRS